MKEYISYLRCVATFSVVLLHTAGIFVEDYTELESATWEIANFIDSTVRFCVPVFLMITGAILLDRDESLPFFLAKRYKRILLPFVFWNLIYLVAKIVMLPSTKSVDFMLFYEAFTKGASHHFWYIYMILGVYLFVPIIRKWTITATKNEVLFFILLWLVTLFVTPNNSKYFINIDLIYFSKYLGYIVLGFYLDKFINFKSFKLTKSALIFAFGVFSTFWLTSFFTVSTNNFYSFFYEYLTPNVALASIGIFLFFKFLSPKISSVSLVFDNTSYGIYLIHVLVLKLITLFTFSLFELNSALNVSLYIIFTGILTYFIAFLIIFYLAKIKPISKFVT